MLALEGAKACSGPGLKDLSDLDDPQKLYLVSALNDLGSRMLLSLG